MEIDSGDLEQNTESGYKLLEEREYAVRQGESYQLTPKFQRIYSVALQSEIKDPKGRDMKQMGIAALITTILYEGSASTEEIQLMANSSMKLT